MDSELYEAAQSGKWEEIQTFSTDFYTQRTVNGNTILHVLAQHPSQYTAEAVVQVLSRKPDLVLKENSQGETPLIIASRRERPDIIRALIDSAKENRSDGGETQSLAEILAAVDHHGNTALHEAVANNRLEAVRLLVEAAPEVPYDQNSAGESPLYLAVEKGNGDEMVKLILTTSKSTISYAGPRKKTALHAAAVRNSPECMNLILTKMPDIKTKTNAIGWTALHFAAEFNRAELVKLLLSPDNSMGYTAAEADDKKTALHVAVIQGHLDVIREILLYCPDCWEMITEKCENVLHLAVQHEHKQVLDFILESSWASELINMQDSKGNTPLHLYVDTKNLDGYNLVNHPCADRSAFNSDGLTPLGMLTQGADKLKKRPIVEFVFSKDLGGDTPPHLYVACDNLEGYNLVNHPIEDTDAFNYDSLAPLGIITQEADKVTQRQNSIRDELVRPGATPGLQGVITKSEEAIKSGDLERLETYMVVATLIITVTFAAGFTVPGGYDTTKENEGMAVLGKKAAFIAFVVSDSLSLMLSIVTVFLQLLVKDKRFSFLPQSQLVRNSNVCITLAMAFLVIAFLAGSYAVLPARATRISLVVVGSLIALPILTYLVPTFMECIGVEEEVVNSIV